MGIFRVGILRVEVILGGNFLWWEFSGWELSVGIIRVAYFRVGVFILPYVTRGMERSHPICLQMRTGGERYHASCVRTHLHYLFSCFCLMVSCFICRNLTLPSFKKGVFVRNGCFSPMRSISVVMK